MLRLKAMRLDLVDAQGQPIVWDGKTLPDQPFSVWWLELASREDQVVDDVALEPFSPCRNLPYIRLGSRHVTAKGLQHFLAVPTLETLHFHLLTIGRKEAAVILAFPKLRDVACFGCTFSEEGWDGLRPSASLIAISFWTTVPANEQCRQLAQALPRLSSLTLTNIADVSQESVAAFAAACPELRQARLDTSGENALLGMKDCRSLHSLVFRGEVFNQGRCPGLA